MSDPAPTLFDATEARDRALKAVEAHADPEWQEHALEVVHSVALRLEFFFVDELWEAGLHPTVEDRALGPVMRRAARLGYCTKTNFTRPSVRSHLSGKPVWRSLIWEGE